MSNTRVIHTNIYSTRAFKILENTWEYLKNNWGSRQMSRNAELGSLERLSNNEIVLNIDTGSWEYKKTVFNTYKDDNIIRGWIANVMKAVVHRSQKSMYGTIVNWDRNCTDVCKFLSKNFNDDETVTIREIYCIYDVLKLRTSAKTRFSDIFTSLIGEELDPFLTEQENIRREEVKRIKSECSKKCSELDSLMYKMIDEAREKIRAEIQAKKREAYEEQERQLSTLNEALGFTLSA